MAKSASSFVRMVLQSITVGRDGKPITPTIGQPFEFTGDEIAQIERMNPAAISTIVSVDAADPASAAAIKAVVSGQGDQGSL